MRPLGQAPRSTPDGRWSPGDLRLEDFNDSCPSDLGPRGDPVRGDAAWPRQKCPSGHVFCADVGATEVPAVSYSGPRDSCPTPVPARPPGWSPARSLLSRAQSSNADFRPDTESVRDHPDTPPFATAILWRTKVRFIHGRRAKEGTLWGTGALQARNFKMSRDHVAAKGDPFFDCTRIKHGAKFKARESAGKRELWGAGEPAGLHRLGRPIRFEAERVSPASLATCLEKGRLFSKGHVSKNGPKPRFAESRQAARGRDACDSRRISPCLGRFDSDSGCAGRHRMAYEGQVF
ncbi:hypothetical protein M885DRAFT_290120 [Pelagophyceae sp. CCMP2097]|nr:hypothetical protein M885DRAFT_290120 [Pelagophyceae sp. CCMP2097]|mmetsp:Transcript_9453/g.33245  ORF Transcript_9453/g.33245 Transcript_9453/m.33245 type:complete len:291 (-) Transcript_9453:403-1275(-)